MSSTTIGPISRPAGVTAEADPVALAALAAEIIDRAGDEGAISAAVAANAAAIAGEPAARDAAINVAVTATAAASVTLAPAAVGRNRITSGADNVRPLSLRRFSATATANMLAVEDEAGGLLAFIDANGQTATGKLAVGTTTIPSTAQAIIQAGLSSQPALVVKAAASHSANLIQYQDSAGSVLGYVSPSGNLAASQLASPTAGNAFFVMAGDTGGIRINPAADANKGLVVRAFSGTQTANLQEWQSSAGTAIAYVTNNGWSYATRTAVGSTAPTTGFTARIGVAVASDVGVLIRGAAAQTGNLTEWQNSASTVVASATPGGDFYARVGQATQVRIGSNILTAASIMFGSGEDAGIWRTKTNELFTQRLITSAPNAAGTGLVARAFNGSQTGNLQEWQNSSNVALAVIGANGSIRTISAMAVGSTTAPSQQLAVFSSGASTVGAFVRGFTSQTADLQQWADSANTVLASIGSAGNLSVPALRVGTSTTAGYVLTADASGNATWQAASGGVSLAPASSATNVIQPTGAAVVPLTLKGAASQSANMLVVQDSAGTTIAGFLSNGKMFVGNSSITSTAGAAAAFSSTAPQTTAANFAAKAIASQTAPAFEVQNTSGTVTARINVAGSAAFTSQVDLYGTAGDANSKAILIGGSSPGLWLGAGGALSHDINLVRSASGVLQLVGAGSSTKSSLVIKAIASQTATLQEWQNSAGSALLAVTAAGLPQWVAAANTQTTVGAAGAASALPATPSKYLKVVDDAGTTLVIPAYAAA